jgi:hypothetical protein
LSCAISYEDHPIPNVHLCVACDVKIDIQWIDTYLKKQAVTFNIQSFGINCLPYTLKTMNDKTKPYNVDYHNLDLYLNTTGNKKQRDRLKRHQKRLNRAA